MRDIRDVRTALTIAGSDSSGGAGIQADIKTMTMNGVFAMSAITALTAQNTTGVSGILESSPEFLEKQLDAIFADIFPDAVKIGMVSSIDLIVTIAASLRKHAAKNIVVDPVMVSTSGARLIAEDAVDTLCAELLPLASVVTPNIPESEILSGVKIHNQDDMLKAAAKINSEFACAVLLKGGHDVNDANDLLYCGENNFRWFYGRRIDNPNTHGTGCTLSSAIAANLAKGFSLEDSVLRAKEYISGALSAMLDLGAGRGPMYHAYNLSGKFSENRTLEDRLADSVADIWQKYYEHEFVKGIETGKLEPKKFRHYMIQDYLYLNEYAKVFSLGITKAKDSESDVVKLCARTIQAISEVELDVHRGYMAKFGVTQEEIDRTPRTLENLSYTSYMIRIAYDEGVAEIMAAILSCALSYEAIAKNILRNNPDAVNHELYGNWLKCYSGEVYCSTNVTLLNMLEELTRDYTDEQMQHIFEIYRVCSLYELEFWNMANSGGVEIGA